MGLRVFLEGVLCFKVGVRRVGVFLEGVLCFKVGVRRVGVFLEGVLCFKVGVRAGVRVGVFLDGDSSSTPSKTLSEDIYYSYI
jgi:hypothetical protein